VGTVKGTQAQIVIDVVVEPDEAFGPVGIGKEPSLEPLFDALLLLAGGERLLLIEDALFPAITERLSGNLPALSCIY
jgi:hypothetical protein